MADEDSAVPPALPPLGPGDDDPRSPRAGASEARSPLGPGDDDPKSPPKGEALPAVPPLGAGASVGVNPDEEFHFLAPPQAGPGDAQVGPRNVVRIPKVVSRPPMAEPVEE